MYIDQRQYAAWCRMAKYDTLPPYKRSFMQRHNELFELHEVRKHSIAVLRANRKRRSMDWCRRTFGKDHPGAQP